MRRGFEMNDTGFTVERERQLVAFRVGREEFGVDVMKVEGVISMVDITRMPGAPWFVEGIINLRGQIIAVVDLAARLGIEPHEGDAATRIVVVESQEIKVGVLVASPQVINISAEDIEPSPVVALGDVDSSFIEGVVKLDERLLILLDVDRILTEDELASIEGAVPAPGVAEE